MSETVKSESVTYNCQVCNGYHLQIGECNQCLVCKCNQCQICKCYYFKKSELCFGFLAFHTNIFFQAINNQNESSMLCYFIWLLNWYFFRFHRFLSQMMMHLWTENYPKNFFYGMLTLSSLTQNIWNKLIRTGNL